MNLYRLQPARTDGKRPLRFHFDAERPWKMPRFDCDGCERTQLGGGNDLPDVDLSNFPSERALRKYGDATFADFLALRAAIETHVGRPLALEPNSGMGLLTASLRGGYPDVVEVGAQSPRLVMRRAAWERLRGDERLALAVATFDVSPKKGRSLPEPLVDVLPIRAGRRAPQSQRETARRCTVCGDIDASFSGLLLDSTTIPSALDLFRFERWVFATERFKAVVADLGITGVAFVPQEHEPGVGAIRVVDLPPPPRESPPYSWRRAQTREIELVHERLLSGIVGGKGAAAASTLGADARRWLETAHAAALAGRGVDDGGDPLLDRLRVARERDLDGASLLRRGCEEGWLRSPCDEIAFVSPVDVDWTQARVRWSRYRVARTEMVGFSLEDGEWKISPELLRLTLETAIDWQERLRAVKSDGASAEANWEKVATIVLDTGRVLLGDLPDVPSMAGTEVELPTGTYDVEIARAGSPGRGRPVALRMRLAGFEGQSTPGPKADPVATDTARIAILALARDRRFLSEAASGRIETTARESHDDFGRIDVDGATLVFVGTGSDGEFPVSLLTGQAGDSVGFEVRFRSEG